MAVGLSRWGVALRPTYTHCLQPYRLLGAWQSCSPIQGRPGLPALRLVAQASTCARLRYYRTGLATPNWCCLEGAPWAQPCWATKELQPHTRVCGATGCCGCWPWH